MPSFLFHAWVGTVAAQACFVFPVPECGQEFSTLDEK
jgi:hypothetical protein